jgi:hypothetical protein
LHSSTAAAHSSCFPPYILITRLVFIADKPDTESGLVGWDFPLPYIRGDTLEQPIFGCNHLKGTMWQFPAASLQVQLMLVPRDMRVKLHTTPSCA